MDSLRSSLRGDFLILHENPFGIVVQAICALLQRTGEAGTFAARDVFFPTYTPPGKQSLLILNPEGRSMGQWTYFRR